jgi:hypothetical protein
MTRVSANNVHDAAAADDLAVLTNPLDAGANLHGDEPSIKPSRNAVKLVNIQA